MQDQKTQLIEQIKQARNVLVTVSKNPSIDQLSAVIGVTLALNSIDKHATAVYSGETPSALEFLRPDETLEQNTDSLRDFIISLDKSKADKLRYKVEDSTVRIFITPYHTAITEADLDFTQGDFNVDLVIGIGVQSQQDLDDAVLTHGRILHDATVAILSVTSPGDLGSIIVCDPESSSLSELAYEVLNGVDPKVLDSQVSTALLTGIVSTTERFRNDRTTHKTMSASAALMASGANQQLISSELETPEEQPVNEEEESEEGGAEKTVPDTIEIRHSEGDESDGMQDIPEDGEPQIHVDEDGKFSMVGRESDEQGGESSDMPVTLLSPAENHNPGRNRLKPQAYPNPAVEEGKTESYDPLSGQSPSSSSWRPIFRNRNSLVIPAPSKGEISEQQMPSSVATMNFESLPSEPAQSTEAGPGLDLSGKTLSELENELSERNAPQVNEGNPESNQSVDAVQQAINALDPNQPSLGAQLEEANQAAENNQGDQSETLDPQAQQADSNDENATPPPVPPPMMPA